MSDTCSTKEGSDNIPGNNSTNHSSQGTMDEIRLPQSATFSIATPAVTTILPMTENMNDTSFMLPATSYQQDMLVENSFNKETETHKFELKPATTNNVEISSQNKAGIPSSEAMEVDTHDGNKLKSIANQRPIGDHSTSAQDDGSRIRKKKNKINKKGTKLDAKSKLEKSRQSARECRARKKLRYQYLEDLVSNREKAVMKLREELSVFCELSKQIDVGTISESDRRLLVDQAQENGSVE